MAGVGTSKGIAKKPQASADAGNQDSSNAMSDYKAFYTAVAKSPTLTTAWSKLLKSAGYYKGPITDKYNPKLQRALDAAEQDRLTIAGVRPLDRNTFINEQIQMGGIGSGRNQKSTQTYITNPTTAAGLINNVFRDLLGRQASQAEINKYYKALAKAQKENPTVTSYADSGTATSAVQTGGLDAQQYLLDKIAATDEAKANKVLGFYNTFMNALGSK